MKKPAFIPFLTKVEDIFLVRPVYIDDKQFIEFNVSLAAALLCGDGIKAVLATDGMSVSIQRACMHPSLPTGAIGRTWAMRTTRTVAASTLIAKCVTNSRRRRV